MNTEKSLTVDILIRIKNESEWIPFLLDSLLNQTNIEIGLVLLLDNMSEDDCRSYLKYYESLNIKHIKYTKEYFPGDMLNYGIEYIMCNSNSTYISIISAHCFLNKNKSLYYLASDINNSASSRSAYGRQIPMSTSDPQAIRDLSLLYTAEPKKLSNAASFNNAFSMIEAKALSEHKFDSKTTNLEDVIWGHTEIKKGYSIIYCPEAEAVHHHGPHHSNSKTRLLKTEKTIKLYSEAFNIRISKPPINPNKVCSIFFGFPEKQSLINLALRSDKKYIVVHNDEEYQLAMRQGIDAQKILFVNSKTITTVYTTYPELYKLLEEQESEYLYFICYDNSYDTKHTLIEENQAISILSNKFSNAIWPVVPATQIAFDMNGEILSTNRKISLEEKILRYESRRGNGFLLTKKSLLMPNLVFTSYNTYDLTKQ